MITRYLYSLLIASSFYGLACTSTNHSAFSTHKHEEKSCCSNTTSDFNKISVLNIFVNSMKSLISDYKSDFSIDNDCRLVDVFICDLTDTTNFEVGYKGCIVFKEGHIYHFASIINQLSYSNIAILHHGQVKLFTAINCRGKGNQLQDVMDFINSSMPEVQSDTDLVFRVINYRKFGFYRSEDPSDIFVCE